MWGRAAVRAGGASALLLLTAACGGGGEAPEEARATAENAYSEVVPAAESSYTPTEFQGIAIDVPQDWAATTEGGTLCMTPPGGQACGYGAVQVLPKAAASDPGKWPKKGSAFNKEDGWTGGDKACLAPGADGKKAQKAVFTVGKGELTQHADGLKSHHRVWEVGCEGGAAFEVRMWFLPESDVLVYVPAADPAYAKVYDEVAASMDITEYKKNA